MSKEEKLTEHFMDFSTLIIYDELRKVLEPFGYKEDNEGYSNGSAVRFINRRTGREIGIHQPHPWNEIKRYIKKAVRKYLEAERYL